MKKRVVERTLVVLMACAACVGVTSCGNDSAQQPAPAPQTPGPQTPVPQPSAPQPPAPQVASPAPAPAAPAPVAAPVTPPPQVETAAVAAPSPAAPSPADDFAELDRLEQVAKQSGADYLTPARAWAGDVFQRKMWICDIAQRTDRAADLVVLAREAQAACSGDRATFGNFCRVARYFKAGASFDEARKALEQAIPLADTKERRDYLAALWRGLGAPAK